MCLAAPQHASVSYQKHMAHHLLADVDRSWLDEMRHCLLLRDPRRVLASYTKVRDDVSLDDLGIPQQAELAEHCELVIDAADFLVDPRGYQVEICRRLDVPFDEAMLRWPPGTRATDGVWARHWYASVEASTGFGAPRTDAPPALTGSLADIAEEALEIYQRLRRDRLVLPSSTA